MERETFLSAFPALRSAILDEWRGIDETKLSATGGELDKVLALLSEHTAHTKALLRRQLEEIFDVVMQPPPGPREPGAASPRRPGAGAGAGPSGHGPQVDQLIEELEKRTAHLIRELRGGVLHDARDRVKDNLIFSLLIAVGLGFIIGVIFNGSGRGK